MDDLGVPLFSETPIWVGEFWSAECSVVSSGNWNWVPQQPVGRWQSLEIEKCINDPEMQFPRHNFCNQGFYWIWLDIWRCSFLFGRSWKQGFHPRLLLHPSQTGVFFQHPSQTERSKLSHDLRGVQVGELIWFSAMYDMYVYIYTYIFIFIHSQRLI